jgi:hypothetical protein
MTPEKGTALTHRGDSVVAGLWGLSFQERFRSAEFQAHAVPALLVARAA